MGEHLAYVFFRNLHLNGGGLKKNDDFVYVFIVIYAIYHIIHVAEGTWSLNKRLPFHLCGFSSVITCFILFVKKKQFWFEFLFYAGILGGLNALLTPLIDNYTGKNFFYIGNYLMKNYT